jgi:hypothetical protein
MSSRNLFLEETLKLACQTKDPDRLTSKRKSFVGITRPCPVEHRNPEKNFASDHGWQFSPVRGTRLPVQSKVCIWIPYSLSAASGRSKEKSAKPETAKSPPRVSRLGRATFSTSPISVVFTEVDLRNSLGPTPLVRKPKREEGPFSSPRRDVWPPHKKSVTDGCCFRLKPLPPRNDDPTCNPKIQCSICKAQWNCHSHLHFLQRYP